MVLLNNKQPYPESGSAVCLLPFGMVLDVFVAFSEAKSGTPAAATDFTTTTVPAPVSCNPACARPVLASLTAAFH